MISAIMMISINDNLLFFTSLFVTSFKRQRNRNVYKGEICGKCMEKIQAKKIENIVFRTLVAAVGTLAMVSIFSKVMPNDEINSFQLKDGRSIAHLKTPTGPDVFYVYSADEPNLRVSTYVGNSKSLLYINGLDGMAYHITDSGYVPLGDIGIDEDDGKFTRFSSDSASKTIKWKKRDFKDIYQEFYGIDKIEEIGNKQVIA